MCLKNLFCGNDCTWILFFIIVMLLMDDDCGCGCGCNSCGSTGNCCG